MPNFLKKYFEIILDTEKFQMYTEFHIPLIQLPLLLSLPYKICQN